MPFPSFADQADGTAAILNCTHNLNLVLLSYCVAASASYIALRLAASTPRDTLLGKQLLIIICALTLGGGIWSMHFIGMLAWQVPLEVRYDVYITLFSLLVAVLGTYCAFFFVTRSHHSWGLVIASGILMGLSIAAMHYTGMASIEGAFRVVYDRSLFALSVLIAIGAAIAALTLASHVYQAGEDSNQLLIPAASLVMGLAIAGMHYTGMAAAIPHVSGPLQTLELTGGTNFELAFDVLLGTVALQGLGVAALSFQNVLRRQADALERASMIHGQILSIPDAVLIVENSGQVQTCNEAAVRLFGLSAPAPTIRIDVLLPEYDLVTSQAGASQLVESVAQTRAGRQFPVEFSCVPSCAESDKLAVVICRDISRRKAMIAQIEELLQKSTRLAMTDALTGLPNRRALDEAIEREMARARRFGHPLCLMLLDLDHFKKINDGYGHLTGDQALRVTSDVMRSVTRGTDFPGRFGGEELVIVLPETDLESAAVIAERLRAKIEQVEFSSPDNGQPVHLTASIGLCQLRPEETADALFARMDEAMYSAKQAGRNRVQTAS